MAKKPAWVPKNWADKTHDRFVGAANAVREHLLTCESCRAGLGCAVAGPLWDVVSRAYVSMIRSCAKWHAKRGLLPDLIKKMERILAIAGRVAP